MRERRVAALSNLVEQLSRQMHAAGHVHDLYPAQWAALRYFAHSPVQHATITALARYQATALPTVSRTVSTLVSKGLLHKVGRLAGQRTEVIGITPEGEKMLEQDPLEGIRQALDEVDPADFESAARVIETIIRRLADPAGGGPAAP